MPGSYQQNIAVTSTAETLPIEWIIRVMRRSDGFSFRIAGSPQVM